MDERAADRAAITAAYRAFWEALVDEDAFYLSSLLDEDFALTHPTGTRQLKQEWLDDISTGERRYHSCDEQFVGVQLMGDEATLVGRSVVDATIHGIRDLWNIQLDVDYERRHDEWVALRAVATQF